MSNNKKSVSPYEGLKQRLQTSSTTVQSLRETMITGLGSGIGFSVADRLVTTVLGPRKIESTIVRSPDCEEISKIYREALDKNEYVSQKSIQESYVKCGSSSQS